MPKEWKKEQQKLTQAEKRKAEADAKRTIARNRRVRHDYEIEETFEAGVALTGTEVKALRAGRASISEAWVEIDDGEAWLQRANIPEYAQGTWTNHAPTRKRRLLLHKHQIARLTAKVAAKGYTIVVTELYFLRGRVKVEIALARGKQEWDKRQAIRERMDNREAQRAMRQRTRLGG